VAQAEAGASIDLDAAYCRGLLPRRDPLGHKFSFGTIVCVAGSLDYAGAALMTALAAARGGAGLVTIAVPDSLRPIFAGRLPESILLGLPETAPEIVDPGGALEEIRARRPSALVIGPGLKETEDYRQLIGLLLGHVDTPAVVDAGAINLLAGSGEWWTRSTAPLVLTPHAGEFERLTGRQVGSSDRERADRAGQAARQFGAIVILKGARTVIANPDGRVAVSSFANPALATAGSGDVLAGLIGALIAQGAKPFDAACLGVYLHGRAGERLSFRYGDAGILATELPAEAALARHELAAHSA